MNQHLYSNKRTDQVILFYFQTLFHIVSAVQVTGLIASTWNIPMFGFVGQSSKLDNSDIYDSYIKIVPPLKRSSEVLGKTLEFFGWSNVAMIGGGLESNTWDKVDALWKTIENLLRDKFKLAAAVKFDTSNPQLVHQNVKYISTVTRGKEEPVIARDFGYCFCT